MTQQSLIARLKAVEEAITYKARREAAWLAACHAGCGCDHNEYCDVCFPAAFRPGGEFSRYTNEVEQATLFDLRELIKEAEGQFSVGALGIVFSPTDKPLYTALGEKP